MEKIKLFIDFDGTLIDFRLALCYAHNKLYPTSRQYIPDDIFSWDLDKVFTDMVNPLSLFETEEFFENLKFIDSYVVDVLAQLKNDFELIVCTVGTSKNVELKLKWLNENLPIIDKVITISPPTDKSMIDMRNAIFIDDVYSMLKSSNAETRICFGRMFPWNAKWDGICANNWLEVYKLLLNVE